MFEVGEKVSVKEGVFKGASGEVTAVTPHQVVFVSETGFEYKSVNPNLLVKDEDR